jgi:hypothetical protein
MLLATSLARAEPPIPAAAAGASTPVVGVPIEIRGSLPKLRLEIQDPRTRAPLAYCVGACQAALVPGRYRFFVHESPGLRAGGRNVRIDHASRILITPSSEAKRSTGLALGIAGPAMMVVGAFMFLSSISLDGSEGRGDRDAGTGLAGLGLMVTGIALTPIGWVMFGTSLRPKVEVTPLGR